MLGHMNPRARVGLRGKYTSTPGLAKPVVPRYSELLNVFVRIRGLSPINSGEVSFEESKISTGIKPEGLVCSNPFVD